MPSETIFVRVDLPIAVPALARSQLLDAVTSENGFIPLERIQYGLAEVASDLMCLPQMIMTATGRRDIVSPVDVASGAIGALPKDVLSSSTAVSSRAGGAFPRGRPTDGCSEHAPSTGGCAGSRYSCV